MAEPVKRGDRYRHSIMVNGVRKTGTFDTKKEAREWEYSLRASAKKDPNTPLLRKRYRLTEAVERYLKTVTPQKRGSPEWDQRRMNDLIARFPGATLDEITSDELSKWRDEMLGRISGSTVVRYFNLYSSFFSVARREWKWIESNPFSDVKRPNENLPRDAIWGWRDIRKVIREGQRRGGKYHQMTHAFRIALNTAMRLQEVLDAPNGFDSKARVVNITKRKEDRKPEKIPLTGRGHRLLCVTPKFTVGANEGSVLFSKLVRQLGIEGLEFRDSRATALTHMSRRMDVQTLKRISRHKDVNLLLNVYYRESAEEISARLR